MSICGKTALLANAILLLASANAGAAEPRVELRRNPFERPVVEVSISNPATASPKPTESGGPGLRAVLVAGSKSVVDFGGTILKVGESTNGYTLLAVGDGRAVFRSNGRKVEFSLYEQTR